MAKYRYEDELDDYELVRRPKRRTEDYDRAYEEERDYQNYHNEYNARNARNFEAGGRQEGGRRRNGPPEDRRPVREPGRRRKKRGNPLLKVLLVLLIIIAILAVVFGVMVFRFYGMSNFVNDESTKTSSVELPSNNGMYNLLIVGVDRRDTSWSGNSDSMILLSINSKKHKIYMISFMRDLYAEIPGNGGGKLNSACAIGGPSLLVQTIEENFRVNIDAYAAVDFESMIHIVDLLGGVTLDITQEEADVANGYISDMANTLGEDPSPHYFYETGTVNADGYQAVAYSRIRYVGNSDYERTERQRTVLSAIMSKLKHMNPAQLNGFMTDIMPYVMHNIGSGDMLKLAPQVPLLALYPTEQDRVPYDDLYYVDGEMLVPDLEATRQRLHDTLY